MSENNSAKMIMVFLAGATVGAAIGYFLNSDKKDELVDKIKKGASHLKQSIDDSLGKAKDVVDSIKKTEQEAEADVQGNA